MTSQKHHRTTANTVMFLSKVRTGNAEDVVLKVHVHAASLSSAFHLYLTGSFTEDLRSKAHRGEACCYPDGTDGGTVGCCFFS